MSTVKAEGTIIYIGVFNGTTAPTALATVCALSVSGGGVEAAAVEIEPCLADALVLDGPGDPKYKSLNVRYKRQPGTGTISKTLEDAVLAKSLTRYGQKFPLAVPVYGTRDAFIVDHDNDDTDRNQHLACTMTLIPQSNWTFSTVAPTTT
jgi:hypothetical protein